MNDPNPFKNHSRDFESNRYVYPVISRRSEGLSLGVNLSLIKECNFACPYCQVDRTNISKKNREIDLSILKKELVELIESARSGVLFSHERFRGAREEYKQLKDIAFSGDGESTTSRYFLESSGLVLELIQDYKKSGIEIKPVVITNATTLHRPQIQKILFQMMDMGGGPWVKLDAGTSEEFQKVADTKIGYEFILRNISMFALLRPVILQTILYVDETNRESFNVENMVGRIMDLLDKGAKLQFMQLYTLARDTKVKELLPVTKERLEEIKRMIESKTGLHVKVYP